MYQGQVSNEVEARSYLAERFVCFEFELHDIGMYKRELSASLQRGRVSRSLRYEHAGVLLSRLPLAYQIYRRKPAGKELPEHAGQDQEADLLLGSERNGHRERDFEAFQPEDPLRKPPEAY